MREPLRFGFTTQTKGGDARGDRETDETRTLEMKSLASLVLYSATCALASDFPQPYNTEPDTTTPLMPAAEAAAKTQVPPGFKVSVFAAEPDVQNPIAMAWAARGRRWLAENFPCRNGQTLRPRAARPRHQKNPNVKSPR